MKVRPLWRRPYVAHAARVAVVATLIIGAMYVCVVAGFDLVDRHRLVGQIDTRLQQRLAQAARQPAAAGSIDDYDNAHDVDDAPVFLWRVTKSGTSKALTPGAPALPRFAWSPSKPSVEARLGTKSFRLQAEHVGDDWFVAAQSLANVDRIESDLLLLEVIAGPVLLIAVFFGTLLIGVKAARPVELARRRQLEFTADASHELRTPLSVIEAEVSLSLNGPRSGDDYRGTLERIGQESVRLRDIVEDLLWLARFDSEPPPPGDEPVDVAAIATACADRFSAVAQRRRYRSAGGDEGQSPPWINAPPEWIDRLTAVLVDNACRYARPGGTVRIAVTVAGNRVSLIVDDSGPGISPEERPKLFDRFHRATDKGNGAGLGLAIADSVVRATGGEWRIGQADLGGAHMEVRWHRSPGAKGPGDLRDAPEPSVLERSPTEMPVVGLSAWDVPTVPLRDHRDRHVPGSRLHLGVMVPPYPDGRSDAYTGVDQFKPIRARQRTSSCTRSRVGRNEEENIGPRHDFRPLLGSREGRLRTHAPPALECPRGARHGGLLGRVARRRCRPGSDRRSRVPLHQGLRALPVQRLLQAHRNRRHHRLRGLADRDPHLVRTEVALLQIGHCGHPCPVPSRPLHLEAGSARQGRGCAHVHAPGHRVGDL